MTSPGPCKISSPSTAGAPCGGATELPRKTRSMLNLAMISVLNRPNELRTHIKAALTNGVTREEIREIFLQVAIYAGVPAAVDSFRIAQRGVRRTGPRLGLVMEIGFIGLGHMGFPMARRLIEAESRCHRLRHPPRRARSPCRARARAPHRRRKRSPIGPKPSWPASRRRAPRSRWRPVPRAWSRARGSSATSTCRPSAAKRRCRSMTSLPRRNIVGDRQPGQRRRQRGRKGLTGASWCPARATNST